MDRAYDLTRNLKIHDRELYCSKDREGKLCVYRNSTRWEDFEIDSNTVLRRARSTPFLIFKLTENWKPNGVPVDWGIEPILYRLKAHDLWNRDLVDEQEKQYEKKKESNDRDSKNNSEAFAHEFRSQFKKVFSDVNTSSMEKIERRRTDEENYGDN